MANRLRRWQQSKSRGGMRRLLLEPLEARYALTGFCDAGSCVSVEMLPEFDTFGNLVETVQSFGEGPDSLVSFAIYDTGASVITWSANDQLLFQLTSPSGEEGIPVKVPGGAGADAIGGGLQGDVSEPGVILAEGLHAIDFTAGIDFAINFQNPARAEGVQSFIGTSRGSSQLPTITGVPIHFPSPNHTTGIAARIDMNAYVYDLGLMFPEFGALFEDLVLYAPDITFEASGQTLEPSPAGDTTAPFRIPMDLFGEDNHANPGDEITYVKNPVQSNVFFGNEGVEIDQQTLLFDTGAQLSVISTELALNLGLNLNAPSMTIDVQGAAGSAEIPGFFIDELQLPIDNNGDGVFDGGLQFNEVPIFVLDIVPGLDGILGMNLFNTADVLLYDPFDPLGPSLQTRFFTDLLRDATALSTDLDGDGTDDIDPSSLNLISQLFPTLAGSIPAGVRSLDTLGIGKPVGNAEVVGRQLFHNNSAFDGHDAAANSADDNAIVANRRHLAATSQSVSSSLAASILFENLPAEQPATAENIISSEQGITGVVVDIANLADPASVSLADFQFRFGNSENPNEWVIHPEPDSWEVREGAGPFGSDRIAFTFPANSLRNGWLEIRVRASEATGLEFDDVFYFGTQSGDVSGDGQVDATDFHLVRTNPRHFANPAAPEDAFDLNRDGVVDVSDLVIVRDRATLPSNQLKMLTPPPALLGTGLTAELSYHNTAQQSTSESLLILPEGELPELSPVSQSEAEKEEIAFTLPIEQPLDAASLDSYMACYAQPATGENTDLPALKSGDRTGELALELNADTLLMLEV